MTLPLHPSQQPQTVCSLLRTKTAFGAYASDDEEQLDWQSGESTTAVFWCLKTMETCGPDDHFAHPSTCRVGRRCYRSDE